MLNKLYKKCCECRLETTFTEIVGNQCPECGALLKVRGYITGEELSDYSEIFKENAYYVGYALINGYNSCKPFIDEGGLNYKYIIFIQGEWNKLRLKHVPSDSDKMLMCNHLASMINGDV